MKNLLKEITAKDVENKETFFWQKEWMKISIDEFYLVGAWLKYKYIVFVLTAQNPKEPQIAAVCSSEEKLLKTIKMFCKENYLCDVDDIDPEDYNKAMSQIEN